MVGRTGVSTFAPVFIPAQGLNTKMFITKDHTFNFCLILVAPKWAK